MITKNEINTLALSPTKKDFYQIWNELLEVAGKLSERWDPTTTNESDPGIVLLKALAGIADKLNYNIDKNTLEAFMPTAAQEDSMRKLCEMLGYNIKYYQSAQTNISVKYYNAYPSEEEKEALASSALVIPKFTTITNNDKDISYFTTNTEAYNIKAASASTLVIPCMEGQIVQCESLSDSNVISINQISEDNRFYLPETQIAENGIFIYNVYSLGDSLADGTEWEKVDNLNVQPRGTRIFKFGYDSYEGRPYVEFPENFSELFNDGIFIYYTRTNGINGNISAGTLTQLELPSGDPWDALAEGSLSVANTSAATNGKGIETIEQAYNNFKKTIGTFETLVTCRDYMNKIYTMVNSQGKPLVSNILVTDMRTDINRAVTICTCNESGILYKEQPILIDKQNQILVTTAKPYFDNKVWYLNSDKKKKFDSSYISSDNKERFNSDLAGSVIEDDGFWSIEQDEQVFTTPFASTVSTTTTTSAIDHFDLVLYPFKSYNQIKNNVKNIKSAYDSAFNYSEDNFESIKLALENEMLKTISHNIVKPRKGDVLSINNYLRLNATIATNSKVTPEEGVLLIEKIKISLANAFNLHELDFGEEIPFDSIVQVIEATDPKIKVASLNEPALYTTFSVLNDYNKITGVPEIKEYSVASDWLTVAPDTDSACFDVEEARKIYNKLALRNVLAGRVPLFNYNTQYSSNFSEGVYYDRNTLAGCPNGLDVPTSERPVTICAEGPNILLGQLKDELPEYFRLTPKYPDNIISSIPDLTNNTEYPIKEISAATTIEHTFGSPTTLKDNEYIKFRAPNLVTTKTYPAYVNYNLKLNSDFITLAQPAKADKLFNILNTTGWDNLFTYFSKYNAADLKTFTLSQTVSGRQDNATASGVTISINVDSTSSTDSQIADIVNGNGCLMLAKSSKDFITPNTTYEAEVTCDIKIKLDNLTSPYITNSNIISGITEGIDSQLTALKNNNAALPTDDWEIKFTFVYMPFNTSTLESWQNFAEYLMTNILGYTTTASKIKNKLDSAYLWRVFGDGYNVGENILDNGSKLLPFDKTNFGLLTSNNKLNSIYIVEDFGQDSQPKIIKNNEVYKLNTGEALYIEYTPSTTSEDGTSQTSESTTEILGEGTIIKPSGFTTGLISAKAMQSDHTSIKKVTFGTDDIGMYSLGTNERIEVQELSNVILDAVTFADVGGVYVYKNFNNCPELETKGSQAPYTLKDGEYIFYTDQNKAELGYFSTGTVVSLSGNVVLPKADIVDLATIWEDGLQSLPWQRLPLSQKTGDKITFQEYQYITLGPGDIINDLALASVANTEDSTIKITEDWTTCAEAQYTPADSEKSLILPTINIANTDKGNGWEVCSSLLLNVSNSLSQTLSSNNTLTLTAGASGGELASDNKLVLDSAGDFTFRTNVTCQPGNNTMSISNVYYNPNNEEGFKLKVFVDDPQAVIKTMPDSLIPYIEEGSDQDVIDQWLNLSGDPIKTTSSSFWNIVDLADLTGKADYDRALKLSPCLLPNTYGIFCIYLQFSSDTVDADQIWIQTLPDASSNKQDLNILNYKSSEVLTKGDRVYLKPGINIVKVSKSSRIFIKAKAGTQGAIYFDNIRLVNCEALKYSNKPIFNNKWYTDESQSTELTTSHIKSSNVDSTLFDATIPGVAIEDSSTGTWKIKQFIKFLTNIGINETGPIYTNKKWTLGNSEIDPDTSITSNNSNFKSECPGIAYRGDDYWYIIQERNYVTSLTIDKFNIMTDGLNLKQLGYLPPLTEEKYISLETYEKLCAESIKSARASLTEANTINTQKFVDTVNTLKVGQADLQQLVDTEKSIVDELSALFKTYGSKKADTENTEEFSSDSDSAKNLVSLLKEYFNTINRRSKLQSLLAAIEAKNFSEIEELGKLYTESDTLTQRQNQFITTLSTLSDSTEKQLEQISKEKILAILEEAPGLVNDTLLTEIKNLSLKLANSEFTNRLLDITNEVNAITNSEERSKLLEALQVLEASSTSDKKLEINTKVKNIIQILSQTDLEESLASAYEQSLTPDFAALGGTLSRLIDNFSNKDLKVLLAEIQATVGTDDAYLNSLLSQLKNQLDSQSAEDSESIISQLKDIRELVAKKLASTAPVFDIKWYQSDKITSLDSKNISLVTETTQGPPTFSVSTTGTVFEGAEDGYWHIMQEGYEWNTHISVQGNTFVSDENISNKLAKVQAAYLKNNNNQVKGIISTLQSLLAVILNDAPVFDTKWYTDSSKTTEVTISDITSCTDAKTGNGKTITCPTLSGTLSVDGDYWQINDGTTIFFTKITVKDSSYTTTAENLARQKDQRINELLIKFNSLKTEYDTWQNDINSFKLAAGKEIMTDLPFAIEAVTSVLSGLITSKVGEFLTAVVPKIHTKIKNLTETNYLASTFTDLCTSLGDEVDSKLIKEISNYDAFKALIADIDVLVAENTQNNQTNSTITEISNAVLQPKELATDFTNETVTELLDTLKVSGISAKVRAATLQKLKTALTQAISLDSQIVKSLATMIAPTALLAKETLSSDIEDFFKPLLTTINDYLDNLNSEGAANILSETLTGLQTKCENAWAVDSAFLQQLQEGVSNTSKLILKPTDPTFISSSYYTTDIASSIKSCVAKTENISYLLKKIVVGANIEDVNSSITTNETDTGKIVVTQDLSDLVNSLAKQIAGFNNRYISSPGIAEADLGDILSILNLEATIWSDLRAIDKNKEFYYNVPVEASLAINLNESNPSLNTLMNPITNYDINNINNSFVTSKLDIDYLTKGLQIARSSKIY